MAKFQPGLVLFFCGMLVMVHSANPEGGLKDQRSELLRSLNAYEVIDISRTAVKAVRYPSAEELALSAGGHPDESKHPHQFAVEFEAFGKTFELELNKNFRLFHPEYQELRLAGKERNVISKKHRRDIVNCYYLGRTLGHVGTEAAPNRLAVSTCNGLSGYVEAFGETYFIAPAAPHLSSMATDERISITGSKHIVYRAQDFKNPPVFKCGVDDTDPQYHAPHVLAAMGKDGGHHHDHDHDHNGLHKYETGSPPHAPKYGTQANFASGSVYVELVAVNDFARFDNKKLETEQHTASLYNMVVSFYESSTNFDFLIRVLLKQQITWTDAGSNIAINLNSNGQVVVEDYLSDFKDYRAASSDFLSNDEASLLSANPFRDNIVGLAYTKAACGSLSASINEVIHNDAFDAATLAHELGHNLGMCHDPPASRPSYCATLSGSPSCSGFIMSASSSLSSPSNRFSSCSDTDFVDFKTSSGLSCLAEPSPIILWGNTSVCGNGFIESNETCDCKGYSDCTLAPTPFTDPCCDGATCTLKSGSACSTAQPCCSSCQIISSGAQKVCRAKGASGLSDEECDLEEICDGTTANCPTDLFEKDGKKESCEESPLSKAAEWVQKNWQTLVVAGVALILLLLVWKLAKACWRKCCEDEAPKSGVQGRVVRKVRSMRKLKPDARRSAARGAGGHGGAPVQTVAGMRLPRHWKVMYTSTGIPVYVNKQTGERYDFRSGPPKPSAPPGY